MGEKSGRDPIWEGHFATELAQAEISVEAVLYEADIPLKQLMMLKVGDTLPLEMRPEALVQVRCGKVLLTEGRMGRVGDRVAPGDVLSAVGDAAGVGKPGLYLEIRKGRQALDPATWLMRR